MKYDINNIKSEHHIMKDFHKFLELVIKIEWVNRIIPWRISRQQKWTSNLIVTVSYFTNTWLKLLLKKWATVQEVFVVIKKQNENNILEKIQEIIYLKWFQN